MVPHRTFAPSAAVGSTGHGGRVQFWIEIPSQLVFGESSCLHRAPTTCIRDCLRGSRVSLDTMYSGKNTSRPTDLCKKTSGAGVGKWREHLKHPPKPVRWHLYGRWACLWARWTAQSDHGSCLDGPRQKSASRCSGDCTDTGQQPGQFIARAALTAGNDVRRPRRMRRGVARCLGSGETRVAVVSLFSPLRGAPFGPCQHPKI